MERMKLKGTKKASTALLGSFLYQFPSAQPCDLRFAINGLINTLTSGGAVGSSSVINTEALARCRSSEKNLINSAALARCRSSEKSLINSAASARCRSSEKNLINSAALPRCRSSQKNLINTGALARCGTCGVEFKPFKRFKLAFRCADRAKAAVLMGFWRTPDWHLPARCVPPRGIPIRGFFELKTQN